jgi:predicted MPP superfamily phosphohydrolase
MTQQTEIAMADVAARQKNGRFWLFGLGSALLVVIYVALRNNYYISSGMLGPNFEVIHDAYDFNLWELPWTLLAIGGVFAALSLTWRGLRKGLFWLAMLYSFVAVDLLALRYYVTYVEPQRLVVKHVRLETPKIRKPLRILHISDIQSGGITDYEAEIFEQIKALQPDLILNTGDFLQVVPPATFESELPKLLRLIKDANPRFGTFAVFGDTELEFYRVSADTMAPLQMLSSRSVEIDTGDGVLSIHGLSLYQSKNQAWALRTVKPWLDQLQDSTFRILFGHAPDYALSVGELPIDLCLAGHTHGGQVRLPWYGPMVIDSKVPREWARGFRRIGMPYLNVSAGAGSNRRKGLPPLRFNCPTEMTLIELVPMRPIR